MTMLYIDTLLQSIIWFATSKNVKKQPAYGFCKGKNLTNLKCCFCFFLVELTPLGERLIFLGKIIGKERSISVARFRPSWKPWICISLPKFSGWFLEWIVFNSMIFRLHLMLFCQEFLLVRHFNSNFLWFGSIKPVSMQGWTNILWFSYNFSECFC